MMSLERFLTDVWRSLADFGQMLHWEVYVGMDLSINKNWALAVARYMIEILISTNLLCASGAYGP